LGVVPAPNPTNQCISTSSVERGGRVAVGFGVLVPTGGTGVGIFSDALVGVGGSGEAGGGDGDGGKATFADWHETIATMSNNENTIEYVFMTSSILCQYVRSQMFSDYGWLLLL